MGNGWVTDGVKHRNTKTPKDQKKSEARNIDVPWLLRFAFASGRILYGFCTDFSGWMWPQTPLNCRGMEWKDRDQD
jgi:hypothetical protein